MAKKIAISSSVLFCVVLAGIVFFLVAAEYPTDTANASALLDQAQAYEAEGDYEQAESIYRSIITDYPGTDEAFQAQKSLALLFVVTRNYSAAQAEVDALITDFPKHPQLPDALYDIANQYWYRGGYQQARGLYKYIADNETDSDWAITGQTWVAGSDIWSANYPEAHREIDTLIRDFAGHQGLTDAVYETANQFWYVGRYEDAQQVYQRVLDLNSNSDLTAWSKAWVVGLDLVLGNAASAQQVIEEVVADCNGHPGLAEMIYGIANGCWYVQKYEQAQELYKYIADNMPDSDFAMRAQAWVAGADIMLCNYTVAQEKINAVIRDFPEHPQLPLTLYKLAGVYYDVERYEDGRCLYQHIIDNWPQNEFAAQAQFLIANYYEKLRNSGTLPELEANPKIEQAYQAVVEKYPDSVAVRNASIELGWLNFKRGQWIEAIQYWQLSMQRSLKNDKPVHILYPLGRAYEEIGRSDKAIQLYNEFINFVPSIDPRIEKVKSRLELLALIR